MRYNLKSIRVFSDTETWLLTTLVDGEYTDNVSHLTVKLKSDTAFGILCEIGKYLVKMSLPVYKFHSFKCLLF